MVQTYSWFPNQLPPLPPLLLKDRLSPRLDWFRWEQDFSQYAGIINLVEKPPKQQVHIFLKAIGPEACTIFNLFKLTEEEALDLTVIKNKFTEHFNRHVVVERYRFHRLYQRSYVPFEDFLYSVCTAADSCEFGEMKEDFIRDKLVVSIDNNIVRAKLLREPNLTLPKAIGICRRELTYPRQTYQQWKRTSQRKNEMKSKHQLVLNKGGSKAGSFIQGKLKNLAKTELDVKAEFVAPDVKTEVEEGLIAPENIKQEPEERDIMLEIDNLVNEIGVPPQHV